MTLDTQHLLMIETERRIAKSLDRSDLEDRYVELVRILLTKEVATRELVKTLLFGNSFP